jgi:hypothetical protein
MKTDFSWASPIGLSSILFMAIAAIYVLIGGIGLILIIIFAKPIADVNRDSPQIGNYISILMIVFCSFMVSMGILQFGIAKYALIEAARWALWYSVISNLFMLIIYWVVVIVPVMKEFKVGYFALWHPYALIPTLLLPIATILGWLGLKS